MAREKSKYEVRQVDAWAGMEEGLWEYNDTFFLFEFETAAKDEEKAFRRALNRHGIKLTSACKTVADWECIEVLDRKTDKPYLCAYYRE